MRIERERDGRVLCRVEAHGDCFTISNGGQDVDLTRADIRWLHVAGLPVALTAAEVPSDPPAKAQPQGDIPGQTTIEDALTSE